jgi:hypothetical protein
MLLLHRHVDDAALTIAMGLIRAEIDCGSRERERGWWRLQLRFNVVNQMKPF